MPEITRDSEEKLKRQQAADAWRKKVGIEWSESAKQSRNQEILDKVERYFCGGDGDEIPQTHITIDDKTYFVIPDPGKGTKFTIGVRDA